MSKFKRQIRQQLKADAILSADIHIRPDTPVCRIDDYWAAQEKKIDFILDLAKEHGCPLLVAGDLGNYPLNQGWPTWLLEWFINKLAPITNRSGLNTNIICIPGQHDLPNHRLDLFEKSGMGVLTAAEAIKTIGILQTKNETELCHFPIAINSDRRINIFPFPYGSEIKQFDWERYQKPEGQIVAIAHQMVIENKPLWPGQKAPKGHQLLKKFPEYNLILTGDNHNAFVAEYEGRLLVNPGSMMRMVADMEDHKPRVYLWYAESNEVVPVYLPIEQGVISREHIEMADERSDRMDAYMARVREDVEIQLSYEDNMGRYFERFRTERPVKAKVLGAMG